MVTTVPDTSSDYLYVDGTEEVTLTDGTLSITVEHAKRSRIEAGNQISGMDVGGVLFDLPMAEVTGSITEPVATYTIEVGSEVFVIVSVRTLVISQIWQCYCRVGLEVS